MIKSIQLNPVAFVAKTVRRNVDWLLIALLLSSCGIDPDHPLWDFRQKASLAISKPSYSPTRYCESRFIFTYLHDGNPTAPVIGFIAFDKGGNTLDQRTIYFDTIYPHKFQEKQVTIQASCADIAKIVINEAHGQYNIGEFAGVIRRQYNW